MKAIHWKPNQRVKINRIGSRRGNRSRLRNGGTTTDRSPEKIDSLIKVEVKLDDGDLVMLPVHLLSNI
jgi:hypothetical protein